MTLLSLNYLIYHTAMTVEQYIAEAPEKAKPILREIRQMVMARCPHAEETMSYKMPAFKAERVFIYFAAFKNHVGIYPPVETPQELVQALQHFRGPKGNLQFPYAKDIPYELIEHVIDALYTSYAVRT